ncbi:MAG: hypothetical protein ABIJ57_10515, partial [Pseudomonadota bacterium]
VDLLLRQSDTRQQRNKQYCHASDHSFHVSLLLYCISPFEDPVQFLEPFDGQELVIMHVRYEERPCKSTIFS